MAWNVTLSLHPSDADWHQYDDIICMKPPGQLQRFFNHIWDTTKKNVMRGKQIAACVMLDRLLSVLQTWNAINLKNFFTQFKQFYFVVHMPTIHEGNAQPWQELQYEEKQVSGWPSPAAAPPSARGPPAFGGMGTEGAGTLQPPCPSLCLSGILRPPLSSSSHSWTHLLT